MESLSDYMKHSLKESEVLNQINDWLRTHEEYKVVHEYTYPNTHAQADFMLLKNNDPYMAIEVKGNLEPRSISNGRMQLQISRRIFNFRYGVVTNGLKYYIFDLWENSALPQKEESDMTTTLNCVMDLLAKPRAIQHDEIQGLIQSAIQKVAPDMVIQERLVINNTTNTVSLSSIDELHLFDCLFPPRNQGTITRYTTLDTLFATIDNDSYRMFAYEGMNDKEDCDYLWKKLYEDAQKDQFLPKESKTVYLMSCVDIEDEDLTMWRLYAEDTRGIRMKFKITDKANQEGFYLREVSYGEEMINKLKTIVKYGHEGNPTFVFNYWSLWAAFFKNGLFEDEEEIRLVYLPHIPNEKIRKKDNTKEWVLTDTNRILNQYVDFKIDNNPFPLELQEVLLGCACPEKDLNVAQFQKMINKSVGFNPLHVMVKSSMITTYRPSRK
ncbi:MAG: hypothetical protein MJZ20_07905 [Bacteroidaceae bacterium]|nr:hypothetical protein [Bacteroidaceae bacterium]